MYDVYPNSEAAWPSGYIASSFRNSTAFRNYARVCLIMGPACKMFDFNGNFYTWDEPAPTKLWYGRPQEEYQWGYEVGLYVRLRQPAAGAQLQPPPSPPATAPEDQLMQPPPVEEEAADGGARRESLMSFLDSWLAR